MLDVNLRFRTLNPIGCSVLPADALCMVSEHDRCESIADFMYLHGFRYQPYLVVGRLNPTNQKSPGICAQRPHTDSLWILKCSRVCPPKGRKNPLCPGFIWPGHTAGPSREFPVFDSYRSPKIQLLNQIPRKILPQQPAAHIRTLW